MMDRYHMGTSELRNAVRAARREVEEVERLLRGAKADLAEALRRETVREKQIVHLEREVERLTHENARINEHRARLLAEKDIAWGVVLAPDVTASEDTDLLNSRTISIGGVHHVDADLRAGIRRAIEHLARAQGAPQQEPMNHLTTNQEGGE